MNKPKCILIPVDFSELSIEALDFGAMLANQTGSEIILLTVEELSQHEVYDVFYPELDSAATWLRDLFQERMEKWSKDFSFPYEKQLRVIVREGKAAAQILLVAKETNADMIVMGTHGRRGIARAILGSVTEQVIRRAPCPVLAIRSGSAHLTEMAEVKTEKNVSKREF